MTRYPLFDILRPILAFSVVALHIALANGLYKHLWGLLPMVPAFLGISGFVVLQSYEHSRGWPHFIWKRFLRIGPAFAVSFLIVATFLGPSSLWEAFRAWASLGLVRTLNTNVSLWSLGWEELYYGLLAVLFTFGIYRRAIWAIWLGLFLGLGLQLATIGGFPQIFTRATMLPSAFFTGNLFYVYRGRVKFSWLAPLCMALSITLLSYRTPGIYLIRGNQVPVQVIGLELFIASMLWMAVGLKDVKVPKLPDLSYSSYVYHQPVILGLLARGLHGWQLIVASLAILVPLCVASWYWMESKALRFKDWRLGPRPHSYEPVRRTDFLDLPA